MDKKTVFNIGGWIWLILLATILLGKWIGEGQLEPSLFEVLWVVWGVASGVLVILAISMRMDSKRNEQ